MRSKRRWKTLATRLAAGAVLGALVLLGLAALLTQPPIRKFLPLSAPYAVHEPANTTAPAAEVAITAQSEPGVVYVSDKYVPGHARAHPELCPDKGANLRLLILVTSAPSHTAARDAVRLTWGHYGARSDVVIAFMLGQVAPILEDALVAEDALYGDLIVGNFIDSYSNLTLKTISMLEWTMQYCSRVPYLFKTDDDMFINVPRLLSHVSNTGNASYTIWGRVMFKSPPIRSPKSKYFVSKHDWSDRVFPNFVTGPAYLMTVDCVRPLLHAAIAPLRRFLFLEDVFFTGVLATELGIRRVPSPSFYNLNLSTTSHPCAIWRIISVHHVVYHEQFEFWRKLLDGKTKCAQSY